MQPTAKARFRRIITGSKRIPVMYGTNLNALAQRTYPAWGLSGVDILNRHTVFPYYSFYMGTKQLAALRSYTERTRRNASLMDHTSVPLPKQLKYCRSCVGRDLGRLGETYWRRTHQLSGILLCTEHEEILVNSVAPSSLHEDPYDATATILHRESWECADLTAKEVVLALDIARRCRGLMTSAPSEWNKTFPPVHLYRRAALELGYEYGMQKVNAREASDDFYKFYDSSFLSRFGINISAGFTQVQKLLHGSGDHPLLHILLQLFFEHKLEGQHIDFNFTRRIVQEVRCPNSHAKHIADFRITDIRRRRSAARGEYFVAHCSCGYAFSFKATGGLNGTMPVVIKQFRYGPTFVKAARRLYGRKPSISYVARKMGLSRKVTQRLVHGVKSWHDREAKPIAQWRAEWMKSNSKAAYQALLIWDHEWIRAQGKRSRPTRRSKHREDAAIAREIRKGVQTLLVAKPPRRVTCCAVCTQIGRPGLRKRLSSLPHSQAEMSKATETLAAWHSRKARIGG
jgi:hypothetical protein